MNTGISCPNLGLSKLCLIPNPFADHPDSPQPCHANNFPHFFFDILEKVLLSRDFNESRFRFIVGSSSFARFVM
jgi:hypothetical protein